MGDGGCCLAVQSVKSGPGHLTVLSQASQGLTKQRLGTTSHRPGKGRQINDLVNFTRVLLNLTADKQGPGQFYSFPGQLYCRQTSQVIK